MTLENRRMRILLRSLDRITHFPPFHDEQHSYYVANQNWSDLDMVKSLRMEDHFDSTQILKCNLPFIGRRAQTNSCREKLSPKISAMQLSNFRFNQAIAACFVTFGGIGVGFALAWSATALPSLEETGQVGLPLTSTDKSWIGSLVNVGALIACPVSGQLMNRIGRRSNLIAFSLLAIPGWCLLVWATSPLQLSMGRFLCGLSAGGTSVAVPVYIREISSNNNRGVLGSFYFFAICVGKAFSNVVGIICPAHVASMICGLQPVIFIMLLLLLPESPTFLVKKCRINDALSSLSWLQHGGAPVPFPCSKKRVLLAASQQSTRQALAQLELIQDEHKDNETESSVSLKMFLTRGELLKPSLTAFILIFAAQLCGVGVLTSYTVEILQMSGDGAGISEPKLATVLLGVLQAAACIPASLIVDRSGRRPLFLSSFVVMTLSMQAISVYFFAQQFHPTSLLRYPVVAYLPFGASLLFLVSYSWGLGNIVFVTLAELLPPQVVGPASAASSVLYWAAAFIVTQTFQRFKEFVSPFVWFAIYAGVCFAAGCFTLIFLPETKGLSLEEIQQFYKSSKQKGASGSEA